MSQHDSSSLQDAYAGLILIGAAILALICANSPLSDLYHGLLQTRIDIRIENFAISKPLMLWINDGLMAVFFFLVGLEIKYEFKEGALSSRKKAILPAIAALGGMIIPALIYALIAEGDSVAMRGWAVPVATDIAFALGILGLMAHRVPPSLKAFLLALAVLDDLGAIIIIAAFYTSDLSLLSLGLAAVSILVLAILHMAGVRKISAYGLVGVILWVCVLKSGVHATLSGVITALFIPLSKDRMGASPLHLLARDLKMPVTFAIMPLFAFANAGVSLSGISINDLGQVVTLGVMLGLVLGKPLGIGLSVLLVTKLKIAHLPDAMTWWHLVATGCIAGVGFTMSLFIGTLAFGESSAMNLVRLGVLFASAISAMAGLLILALFCPDYMAKQRRNASPF